MTTVIITNKSKAAKQMVEFLKTQPYAKVFEEDEPNAVTLRAVEELKTGETITYKNSGELISKLRKSNV
jgi:hypothetical protein